MNLSFAGGQPEVTAVNEKEVTANADLVFEAIFVASKTEFKAEGKVIKGKELTDIKIRHHSSGLADTPTISIHYEITLVTTKVIKGNLKKHQIYTIKINDIYDSECPHILNIGDFRAKQIYYIFKEGAKLSYLYQTVREELDVSDLANRYKLKGELGKLIGMELEIKAHYNKDHKDNPFGDPSEFETTSVNGEEYFSYIDIKLDPKYKAAGGKLNKSGKPTIYLGYETIDILPFADEKELIEFESKHPSQFKLFLQTTFFVTETIK